MSHLCFIIKNNSSTLHFDADSALNELGKMLEDSRPDNGVRPGDICGLIVEHYVKQGEMEKAITILEKMPTYTGGKSLTHFLSPETTAVSWIPYMICIFV